ncbi:radical SAM family heme chaperone HemW [Mycoplasmoides alvi]|uniref:radical SAM family heme chaperone HemW n=1 Tax=Mycoplasmoides alvi TaxID=78580 RepID=UPI00051C5F8A|nr:radical SAM family heme chaperone HemW [Mycoplasmoides alvi]
MNTKHLYIHIPLCKSICTFCDFKRELICNYNSKEIIDYLINKLKKYKKKQFDTIYIGGGTPNVLDNDQLNYFLSFVKNFLSTNYEFTIECNPEFINESQIKILKNNLVNRISLGVQSTNDKILRILNRAHTIEQCSKVIKLLQKFHFNNISLDFMYALPLMKVDDAKNAVQFAIDHQVQHVSFYGLDLKPNAILTKKNYQINYEEEENQLSTIIKEFNKSKFKRYEVSNWAISKKYESKHNLAYWLTKDWAAIGYGAHGFENRIYYSYEGTILKPKKKSYKLTDEEYYQQVLIMGLRLKNGIDISIEPYKSAFNLYKNKLIFTKIKGNILKCQNINLLNSTLVNII